MKKIANKTMMQKLILSIICIMLIMNFTVPTYSQAGSIANSLFKPIKGLVCAIGDSVMSLLQACFIGKFEGVTDQEGDGHNSDRWGTVLWVAEDKVEWPTILITPEEIFQGKIPALNVNFIKEIEDWDTLTNGGTKSEEEVLSTSNTQTSLISLRNTISRWYMTLRNISIVGLLSVLVYIGIRMMLCSVASEKAKYKQMLMDWVIALCLIFFLHYIMSLTMTITEQITGIFTNSSVESIGLMSGDIITVDGTDKTAVSNLMEYARVYVSLADAAQSCAYLIIYVWLIVYTVRFIIVYMKRFIHMAFLTLIAPLVALTYPIDKLNDGKAQAFNMWFRDYIFNALIQPFHLIIYTVFVSSAMDFATNNLIYACVAIGFIIPAEKFLRKMFGFDKAPNPPGGLGSFAGGAMASQAFNKLKSAGNKSGGNGGKEENAGTPARTKPNYTGYIGNGAGNSNENASMNNVEGNRQNELPEGERSENAGSNGQENMPNDFEGSYGQGEFDDYGYNNSNVQEQLETGEETENVPNDFEGSYGQGEFDDYGYRGGNNNGEDSLQQTSEGQVQTTPTNTQLNRATNTGIPRNARQTTNTRNNQRKISGFKKFGKGIGNVAKKRWKGVAKAGLGVGGALLGGAAMGLHALATGKDPNDILKSTLMGAAGGATLGYGAIDKTIGLGKGIADTGRNLAYDYRSGYDKEGADKQFEKQAFMRDKRQQQFIKQNFTGSDGGQIHGAELKERMAQSYAMYEAGITDEKTRKKVMKLEDQINDEILGKLNEQERRDPEQIDRSREIARQQALITNELAGQYSASTLLKDQDKIRNSIAGNIETTAQAQGINMTQEQIEKNAEIAVNRLADYHGVSLDNSSRNNTPTPQRDNSPRNNIPTPQRDNPPRNNT